MSSAPRFDGWSAGRHPVMILAVLLNG